jgi:hypothetical protein
LIVSRSCRERETINQVEHESMLTCPNPTCGKKLPELQRECPRCRADLSLLVDYVENLQDGLARAQALTRAGELGEAVWAYLAVLEVDPDNALARRQVGQVATAVRQFDRAEPGRRWMRKVRRQARFRAWAHSLGGEGGTGWLSMAIWFIILLAALVLGYAWGYSAAPQQPPAAEEPAPAAGP